MAKYRTWAFLNLKGKEQWGVAFFDGLVPIKIVATQKISFDALSDPESVFSLDWKELTTQQKQVIIEKINQNHSSNEEILSQIEQSSVPLPRSHVHCFGVGDKTFFPGESLNESNQ